MVLMKIQVFWNITSCCPLANICNSLFSYYLPADMESYLRRLEPSVKFFLGTVANSEAKLHPSGISPYIQHFT